jgi:hypothetical protein
MVDMGDDAKITNVGGIHRVKSRLLARKTGDHVSRALILPEFTVCIKVHSV